MSTQNLLRNFYSNLIQVIAENWRQLRYPSTGGFRNKRWHIRTLEHYSVIKRLSYQVMNRHRRTLMHITKWNKSVCKGYKVYDFNYLTFWKRRNYIETSQRFRRKEKGMSRRGTKTFLGSKTVLYSTINGWMHNMYFSKSTESYNAEWTLMQTKDFS